MVHILLHFPLNSLPISSPLFSSTPFLKRVQADKRSRIKKRGVKYPPKDDLTEDKITLTNNFQALAETGEENTTENVPIEETQPIKREKIPPTTLSKKELNYEALKDLINKTNQKYKTQFLGKNPEDVILTLMPHIMLHFLLSSLHISSPRFLSIPFSLLRKYLRNFMHMSLVI